MTYNYNNTTLFALGLALNPFLFAIILMSCQNLFMKVFLSVWFVGDIVLVAKTSDEVNARVKDKRVRVVNNRHKPKNLRCNFGGARASGRTSNDYRRRCCTNNQVETFGIGEIDEDVMHQIEDGQLFWSLISSLNLYQTIHTCSWVWFLPQTCKQ